MFLSIAILGIILINKHRALRQKCGITVSQNIPVRTGPDDSYRVIETLGEAQEVIIKGEIGKSLKIASSKYTGWVNKRDIKKV